MSMLRQYFFRSMPHVHPNRSRQPISRVDGSAFLYWWLRTGRQMARVYAANDNRKLAIPPVECRLVHGVHAGQRTD